MFSETEFYPTPKPLIRKMLSPYKNLSEKTILEPSAGKGDIIDFIKENVRYHDSIYCIEQNHDLVSILQGKGYRVIGNDFLHYSSDYIFDLIVMNPPFSNGDEHLLKAWEIMEHGDICCLLNAQTVKNPRTARRKLLASIIKTNGSIEYISNAFKSAERKTGVEVALVRLQKKSDKKRFDFFENKTREAKLEFDEATISNAPARRDVIGNMIIQYEKSKEAFVKYMVARDELYYYAQGLMPPSQTIATALHEASEKARRYDNFAEGGEMKVSAKNIEFNAFVDQFKSSCWNSIFTKTKLREKMTGKVQDDFEKYSKAHGCMDFTQENIENLFMMLVQNSEMIMGNCIIDVFEELCSFDEKNKIHIEGWKTNDAYKVNSRVILPYFVEYSNWGNGGKFAVTYRSRGINLDDIDKVMCFISATKFDSILTIRDALKNEFGRNAQTKTAESEYFKLKFFKKGTLHIEFKDKYLWQEFNMRAAKGKNWLPEENGKRKKKSKK